jgi:hypothetical protein
MRSSWGTTKKLYGGNRLSMDKLKDILWPIVAIGGLGAFIDFLIGKAGQESAKDFLLRWWVRFDDVHWNNFGREEGLFAGRLIERWFGRSFWSFRRLATTLLTLSLFALAGYIRLSLFRGSEPWCLYCDRLSLVISFAAFAIGFNFSVSFTKFTTFRMAYLCGIGQIRNLMVFATILLINWFSLTFCVKDTLIDFHYDLFDIVHPCVTVKPARIGALQYLSAAEPKAQTPRAWSLLHTLEMALRSYILGLTAGPVPGPSVAITAGRY